NSPFYSTTKPMMPAPTNGSKKENTLTRM
ncbi:virulence factor, partial [Salmonella enterica subsp. arizonae]|nr:virulence factor [Salmonella enterica subsp. arizonae]